MQPNYIKKGRNVQEAHRDRPRTNHQRSAIP
jgi:hypothetical protein